MIVTIDGPAGAGKSTAAKRLARRLGFAFLDTGATYRAMTLKAMRSGTALDDASALTRLAGGTDLKLVPEGDRTRVFVDGEEVTDAIRAPEVTANVRHLASAPDVRGVLVEVQRRIGRALSGSGLVTEGRDQGTVVFPDADVKVFLHADVGVRARRRTAELRDQGRPADEDEIREQIEARDRSDRTREVGPLTEPNGAVRIDSSEMSIDEMVDTLERIVHSHNDLHGQ